MLKHHLLSGVRKGALTEEQVEEKFQAWLKDKEQAIQDKKDGLSKAQQEAREKALEAERKKNEERLAALAPDPEPEAQDATEAEAAEVSEAGSTEGEVVEAATEETTADEVPADEAPADETSAEEASAGEETKKD